MLKFIPFLTIAILAAGCGQKGPLVIPEQDKPESADTVSGTSQTVALLLHDQS